MTNVTCRSCRAILDELGGKEWNALDVYDVGNPARPDMGHQLYFTSRRSNGTFAGRIALCSAPRRLEVTETR